MSPTYIFVPAMVPSTIVVPAWALVFLVFASGTSPGKPVPLASPIPHVSITVVALSTVTTTVTTRLVTVSITVLAVVTMSVTAFAVVWP